jgi:hypothetical protein
MDKIPPKSSSIPFGSSARRETERRSPQSPAQEGGISPGMLGGIDPSPQPLARGASARGQGARTPAEQDFGGTTSRRASTELSPSVLHPRPDATDLHEEGIGESPAKKSRPNLPQESWQGSRSSDLSDDPTTTASSNLAFTPSPAFDPSARNLTDPESHQSGPVVSSLPAYPPQHLAELVEGPATPAAENESEGMDVEFLPNWEDLLNFDEADEPIQGPPPTQAQVNHLRAVAPALLHGFGGLTTAMRVQLAEAGQNVPEGRSVFQLARMLGQVGTETASDVLKDVTEELGDRALSNAEILDALNPFLPMHASLMIATDQLIHDYNEIPGVPPVGGVSSLVEFMPVAATLRDRLETDESGDDGEENPHQAANEVPRRNMVSMEFTDLKRHIGQLLIDYCGGAAVPAP